MNKVAVILLIIFSPLLALANVQDSCSILINKKVVYSGGIEQQNPVVLLKQSDIKKRDCISINYAMQRADTGWNRTFYINDSLGNDIKIMGLNEPSGCVSVRASVLKKMIDNNQTVFIYTMSLPKDPEVAKRVRVRRLLLCKIEWN